MHTLGSIVAAVLRRGRRGDTTSNAKLASNAGMASTDSRERGVHAPQALRSPTTTTVAAKGESEQTNADQAELMRLYRAIEHMSRRIAGQQEQMATLLRALGDAVGHQRTLASLQHELEIARSMQLSILPRHAPAVAGVEIEALMVPAQEVGGDFYDYFLIGEDHLAMVIADVSGKGIPAAFFMAIARTLLKNTALYVRRPAQVIERLNEHLSAGNEQMMFVTAFFGVLDLRSGVLEFVNAGHNPPVIRGRRSQVRMLPRNQNVALAVLEGAQYRQGRAVLAPGDTLLLYTDGVTEANDATGRMFGEQRLLEAVLHHQPGKGGLLQELLRKVRDFECGEPQVDDIACVALRYVPGV